VPEECDVCSLSKDFFTNLAPLQVLSTPAYWAYAFTHQWSYVISWKDRIKVQGVTVKKSEVIESIVRQMGNTIGYWRICNRCMPMFGQKIEFFMKPLSKDEYYQTILAAAKKGYDLALQSVTKTVLVTAETPEKASALLKSSVPENMVVLEKNWPSEALGMRYGIAETVEEAFNKATSELPPGEVVEKNILLQPEIVSITYESVDENTAKEIGWSKGLESTLDKTHVGNTEMKRLVLTQRQNELLQVKDITLEKQGKGGLMGLGKKPNLYKIILTQKAAVEIVYKYFGIYITIGEKEYFKPNQCKNIQSYPNVGKPTSAEKSTREEKVKRIKDEKDVRGLAELWWSKK
jgi:hypothetical protein